MAAHDPDEVGRSVGVLTGVNTVAAVCGSLLAGFAFLPWLGLGGSSLLVAALYGALAVVGFWRGGSRLGRWIGTAACILLLAGWYATGLWQPIYQPLSEGEMLVQYRECADASVAVVERSNGDRAIKLNHEYTLGSSAAADRELRQGRLPLLLHPDPRRVAFIGAATGITSGAALDFPVERLVAIELIRGVADALPLFEPWNAAFYKDPRAELVVDDGRNFLLGTREEFDVVVSDLFVPWHAGTGDLYTVEHFRTVRDRLAPGGIFAQWLPGYQLTVDELRTIAASFVEVFPHSTLWRNDFSPRFPMICLVGYRDEMELRPDRVAESRARIAGSKLLGDALLSSPGGLALMFLCGEDELQKWAQGAELNTDEHPIIEYTTPMSFLRHRQVKNVGPIQSAMASFRPRRWCYPQRPTDGVAVENAFRAADILHDATVAGATKDVEQECQLLLQLEAYIEELPAAGLYMTRTAVSYHRRHMSDRAEQLLAAVIRHAGAPAEAFAAMASLRKDAGDEEQAIELLQRAVQGSTQSTALRKQLVELLTKHEYFDRLEPHLLELLRDAPNDPYLRLDLARAYARQSKTDDARAQLDEFRARWDGTNQQAVWRYLRSLGLGPFVDAAAPPAVNATAPEAQPNP
jgi:tetratricopeptide (TPR) repeat protein